ncbi:MAG TPA: preprotein translocase subunit YajC [Longimicrobium sp.]|nr:preprotein translocase subunit YajC [Longimicrobium sp.]
MTFLLLLAQAGGAAAGAASQQPAPRAGGNPLMGMLPIIVIFFLFWVLLIVPQKRAAKQHAAMVEALQKGDQVVTAGGIVGEVVAVKDDQVHLRSGQSTFVVERHKIARRTGPVPAGPA